MGLSLSFILIYPQKVSEFLSKSVELNSNSQMNRQQITYNDTLAAKLFKDVRLLCWIMTTPENHKSKAIHVKRTWGKRCNKLLFMSTANDVELDSIALPVFEGRNYLWDKTKKAFEFIYKNHFDDADWFLKADDDK